LKQVSSNFKLKIQCNLLSVIILGSGGHEIETGDRNFLQN
jgi:hypothetical protein